VMRKVAFALVATVWIAGCAGTPTGPSVMVLAGNGKTIEQFQADDNACRQWASREIERTQGGQVPAQGRYDMAYMQCMYAKGNQIPTAPRPRARTTSSMPAHTNRSADHMAADESADRLRTTRRRLACSTRFLRVLIA